METLLNVDLLWVGIAVAGAGMLGFSIYFSEPKSASARAFLLFTLISILWSLANFASGRFTVPSEILLSIRIVLFFATWHAFSFLLLALQFPDKELRIKKRTLALLAGWTAFISLFIFTPFVYSSVAVTTAGVITRTAPGIALFGLTVLGYICVGIGALIRRFRHSTGTARRQMEDVMVGMVLTFLFLIIFDFIFPAFLNVSALVPLGGLFLLPFIIGTAYAILHYRLFNVRVAIFGLLTFFLGTATFFDVLFSGTLLLVLYRSLELVFVLISGIWLIRSMVREIQLTQDLQKANEQQVILIHFITHQLKGFVTKSRNIFSMLMEGDYGALPDTMKPVVEEGFRSDTKGAETIQEILNAANIKSGKVTYTKALFDLKALVEEITNDLKPSAEAKGLQFNLSLGDALEFNGDRAQLLNALKNLIDNSIKYTPSGEVDVGLQKEGGKIHFEVKDTGVGITSEDMKNLFTEGGHGKESQKINTESTGFGLYIVKNIIEGHGGKVWAESEGVGKGSRFIIELPST